MFQYFRQNMSQRAKCFNTPILYTTDIIPCTTHKQCDNFSERQLHYKFGFIDKVYGKLAHHTEVTQHVYELDKETC